MITSYIGCFGGAGASTACPQQCYAGQYSAAGATACSNAPSGTYTMSAATQTSVCPSGQYATTPYAASCTCTSPGYYATGGVQTQCPAGQYSSSSKF
jgi:hypothetical protein